MMEYMKCVKFNPIIYNVTTFLHKTHSEIISCYQVLNYNVFSFTSPNSDSPEAIFESFINSKQVSTDILLTYHKYEKVDSLPSALHPMSEPVSRTKNEFILLNKNEVIAALESFANDPSWYDDKSDFKVLLDCYFELIKHVTTDLFYVGNELFSNAKPEWKTSDNTFIYEFEIIYIDQSKGEIGISAWSYD